MEAIFEAAAVNNSCDGPPNMQPTSRYEKDLPVWVTGVISCWSSILRVFGRAEQINENDAPFYIKPERLDEAKCIGMGAQGKVHLATLKNKNESPKTVAIKYVQQIDDLTVHHLRNIKHVNIVQTLGVCINPPKYCIVMEYCEQGSLFDYMRQGTEITPVQMVEWARGIACGMEHLHDRNIIHRDLKSPNILITQDMTIKISDFGTSRTIDGQSKVMSFVGTLNWMAPEVICGEKYSNKVDVWSFGVVLWELLTRQIPYYKMEQHAIMWGVGTDGVTLPIPQGIPNSIHILLVQCRNRLQAQRPSFAMIVKSLDTVTEEIMLYDQSTFLKRQSEWAREARDSLEVAFKRSEEECRKKIPVYTQMDPYDRRDLKDKKHALDQCMDATNEMFYKICSLRLALEVRERELAVKERLVEDCNCGVRKVFNLQRELSSSSDGVGFALNPGYRALLRKPVTQLMVNMIEEKVITTTYNELCLREDKINHNKIRSDNIEPKKDTVVQVNGNVDTKSRAKSIYGQKKVRKGFRAVADV